MDRETRPLDETESGDGAARVQPSGEESALPAAGLTLGTTTMAIWLTIVVALVGFFLFARVTVHPDGFDRTMRVANVWTEMADELPSVSRPIFLKILYFTAIAVTLLGAFAAILIALAARAPVAHAENVRSARQVDGIVPDTAGSGD